jgi:hypothetical protein
MNNLLAQYPADLRGPLWRHDVTDPQVKKLAQELEDRLFKLIQETEGTIL